MPMFRKRPVVIEARQLTKDNQFDLARWSGGCVVVDGGDSFVRIPTLEGDHLADYGDWIIKGVKGEFYPCKPDIFAATYEPAEEPPRIKAIREALALSQSIILSGESMTDTAKEKFAKAFEESAKAAAFFGVPID